MKLRPSKLDAHRDDLLRWLSPPPEGEGLTLDQVVERLRERHGVSASPSRLSSWLARQREALMRDRLLDRIATGATLSRDISRQFSAHPAPETEQLVKLLRVLVMQLSVQSQADPALLDLVNPLMRSILDFAKIQEKQQDRDLERQKFEAGLRTKIDLAFDELEAEFKANPEALELFNRARSMVQQKVST